MHYCQTPCQAPCLVLVVFTNELLQVGLMVNNHSSQHSSLKAWASDKQAYLETKESNETSQEAKYQVRRTRTSLDALSFTLFFPLSSPF